MKPLRMKKSKQMLKSAYKRYRKKELPTSTRNELRASMEELQEKLMAKDREGASDAAKELEKLYDKHLARPSWMRYGISLFNLAFILGLAILIRQTWFELYEIPTGSMRPTLQEEHRLLVSKTTFGINMPFVPKHIQFNENLVKRGGIFVFTTAGLDMPDSDMLYFFVFPGKKQYVKRLMGKPGDTLYFYGGRLYGIDKDGHDISPELQNPKFDYVNHVPYIQYEGKPKLPARAKNTVFTPATIHQMNQPVAKLHANSYTTRGEMIADANDYYELWGFKNYGMSRLLNTKLATRFYPELITSAAPAYLEITHHPSIKKPRLMQNFKGQLMPALSVSKSLVPLDDAHLKNLYKSLTTARFIVEDGQAYRYGTPKKHRHNLPALPGIPNGTYEFQEGTAYKTTYFAPKRLIGGIQTKLSADHPLNQYDLERLLTLYNLGIEFTTYLEPAAADQFPPSRYAYFRGGALYSMNMPIIEKGSSLLQDLNSTGISFQDYGAPTKEEIMQRGITVPEGQYLALGDNYAMSADSRDFGFVPAGNLRGAPTFIFWPPGQYFGLPNQAPYTFMPISSIIISTLGILGFYLSRRHQRKYALPLNFDMAPQSLKKSHA